MKTKLYSIPILALLVALLAHGAAYAQCGTTSYTIGAYSSDPHGGNGGAYLENNFSSKFPNGFSIGSATGNSVSFATTADIRNYLSTPGGPSVALCVEPTNNTLAQQLVGVTLNSAFFNLGGEIITSGDFKGKTVSEFLAIANSTIGTCSQNNLSYLNTVATAINQNYDNGANKGYLSCCDKVGPVFSDMVNASTITWPSVPDFGLPTAIDAQDGSCVVTYSDVRADACTGTYTITRTWSATDKCGNTTTATQSITVKDTTPPVIASLPDPSTIECPATPSFAQAIAVDGCDPNVQLTFADVTTPGSCAGNYSVTRTWTATDACGNSSTLSQTINVQDSKGPVIAALPEASTINCPATPSFAQATATDGCGGDVTLTFEDVTTPGSCAGNYSITRKWTATDACGNSSIATQTINVQDITAPTIADLPEASTINCPATPSFAQAVATDGCDPNVKLTFEDVTTAGSCAGNYSVTRTWTATDACGNSTKATQTINVQDITAPVIAALPGVTTIDCPATPSFAQAVATDGCDANVKLTYNDVTTAGSCAGNYSVTRTWTATDACGNSSKATQTINVQDITAPVIAALPAASSITCGSIPVFADATATDGCGVVTLTSTVSTVSDCLKGGYSTTKTWTATDACGNFSTASQTITVVSCEQVTVTQGGWGAPISGNNWGWYLSKNFAGKFPNGLTVGSTTSGKYLTLSTSNDVHNFLPSGGTPTALTKAWNNPTTKTLKNTLAGQTVTLTLNVNFWPSIASLVVKSGSFAGTSVQGMLNIANAVLGGSTAYSASAVNEVLNSININFDGGANLGFLTCPSAGSRGGDVASADEILRENPGTGNDFISLSSYPNPFTDRVKIEFSVQETSQVNLELFNSSGVSVQTLFNGVAEKGVQYKTEYVSSVPGLYIYRMATSHGVISGKVIQIN